MRRTWVSAGVALALAACGDGGGGTGGGGAPTSPGGGSKAAARHPPEVLLDAQVKALRGARKAKDAEAIDALAHGTVPTKEDLAVLLKPGSDTDAFLAKHEFHDLPRDHPAVADLGKNLFEPGEPDRTETRIHAATTEELIAYAKGTKAFDEFPREMKRFAEKVAAPGVVWYVVEHVKPGEDTGMKYSVFAQVGDGFVFLPKPWRALPKEDGGR